MKLATALAALALLTTVAHAQSPTSNSKAAEPTASQRTVVPRETPKEATPLDPFEMKTTDTGDKVQQRLKLDLSKDKDLFLAAGARGTKIVSLALIGFGLETMALLGARRSDAFSWLIRTCE